MYRVVFLTVFFLTGIYVTFLKPQIDAYTYTYLGCLFYFLPQLLGSGFGFYGRYDIAPEMYVFTTLFLILIVVGDRLLPGVRFDLVLNPNVGRLQERILTLFTILIFVLILWGGVKIGGPKARIDGGFLASLFQYFGPLAFVSSYVYRDRGYAAVIGVCLLAFTLIFQVRSTLAFGLASVVLVEARRRKLHSITRIKAGLAGMVCALSFILFDVVKGYVLRGNINYLLNVDAYLGQIVLNNNAHIIFWIFQTVIEHQFEVQNPGQYLAENTLLILPFTSTLFGISGRKFGNIFRRNFVSNQIAGTGIGSNIWAEAYALGDWIGAAVALVVFVCFLTLLSTSLSSSVFPIRVFVCTVLPYMVIFIHRLSLAGLLTTLSNFAMIATATWVLARILESGMQANMTPKQTNSQ
jgi:hypothetical protein